MKENTGSAESPVASERRATTARICATAATVICLLLLGVVSYGWYTLSMGGVGQPTDAGLLVVPGIAAVGVLFGLGHVWRAPSRRSAWRRSIWLLVVAGCSAYPLTAIALSILIRG